jgi:hypothetical protein
MAKHADDQRLELQIAFEPTFAVWLTTKGVAMPARRPLA